MIMSNSSLSSDLPPLPSYTLTPRPNLIPLIPDSYLGLLLPVIAYWVLSMVFHYIDTFDLFPNYRLHTPAEVLKRNHVSRWEVVRDVVIQQVVQTAVGIGLSKLEDVDMVGKEDYDVALWAQRLRLAQKAIPKLLAVAGLDAEALAHKTSSTSSSLASLLLGGQYALTVVSQDGHQVPAFAQWELLAAKALYWVVIPTFQFALAIAIVDTWQYFLHRAMHMNKWLYSKWPPSRDSPPAHARIGADHRSGSHLPLPSSPPLRPIRLWSSIQSPL